MDSDYCVKCGHKIVVCKCKDTPSAVAGGYDLSHPNVMVVVNNPAELAYMQAYSEMKDLPPGWMGPRDKYPIAVSPNGGGWTGDMDRALYYVPFSEFVISDQQEAIMCVDAAGILEKLGTDELPERLRPSAASAGYAVRIIAVKSCRGECPYECEQTNICSITCKQIADPKTIPQWCPLDKA